MGFAIIKFLTLANSGVYSPCFQCGIIYWLFGGAVRNLGSPAHVIKWLQPLQVRHVPQQISCTESRKKTHSS